MNCEAIERVVTQDFLGRLRCVGIQHEACRIQTPFYDPDGDPIELRVRFEDELAVIDDLGQVAGALFSMEQDAETAPGFLLVKSLAHAHGVALDFDEGLLLVRCPKKELAGRFLNFLSVILSIQTSLPHLRTQKRERQSLGPRLGKSFGRILADLRVLSDVRRHSKVPGKTVEDWIVEYLYRARSAQYNVLISTVDLDVANPIRKAEHAITMALDLRGAYERDKIRVLYDTHRRNSDTAQAADLIKENEDLGYQAYNFRHAAEIGTLKNLVLQELSPADSQWQRAFR
ncbi:MAG: DUF1828 domain-containing protein [Bacillota bacterium]|nr:DUF1828 domain-containing protein [Bacillota bacterium]